MDIGKSGNFVISSQDWWKMVEDMLNKLVKRVEALESED